MIILKAKTCVMLLASMLFFVTRSFAYTAPDTVGLKQLRTAISQILNNDLKNIDSLKNDSTTNKIQLLIADLHKVQNKNNSNTVINRALKEVDVFNLKKNEKVHVDSLLGKFTKDVLSLQVKLKAYKKNQANKKDTTATESSTTATARPVKQDSTKPVQSTTSKKGPVTAQSNIPAKSSQINNLFRFNILSAIAFVLMLGILFLYYREDRLNKTILSANKDLLITKKELIKKNNSLENEYDKLNKEYTAVLRNQDNVKEKTKYEVAAVPVVSEKYFFGEAMVTAGPRKNFDTDAKEGDYGLGEDVAGFIVQKNKAFFWVLDGTSDSDKFAKPVSTADSKEEEYFSSRLLAQSIGWNLQQLISEKIAAQFDVAQLLQQAIKQTEIDWTNKIRNLDDISRAALIDQLMEKYNVLQCSTTAIFGILTLDGQLDICRIGDSKIVAYPGENNFEKSTGRQFVTLQRKNEEIELSFNDFSDVRAQLIKLTGINTLIAMTDGISGQMETWLKSRQDLTFDKNTREMFAMFKQKTYDDKSLCIIQIKE